MAYGKRELIEDISDIRRLAGLAEAPKKAAPSAKTAANPDPNNYGSFSTNNNSPYGFAQGGSSDDTSANFFASDKRMRDAQQAAPTTAPPTRSAAPKPAAPAPKPNAYKGTIADFKRDHPGANDGQALNAIQGKTAIRGGNNDPSVIAAKRDADSATEPVQPVYNPQSGTTMRKGEVPGQVPNRNTEPGYSGATGAELLKPGVKNAPPTGALPSAPTGALPSAPTTRGLGAAPKSLPPRPGAAEVNVPIIRPDSPRDTSTTGGYDLDERSDPAPLLAFPTLLPGRISTPQSRQDVDDAQDRADAASRLMNPRQPAPPKPVTPASSRDHTYRNQPGTHDGVYDLPQGTADRLIQNLSPNAPVGPNPDAFTPEPAKTPGPQSYFKPTSDEVEAGALGGSEPYRRLDLGSKNNSIFPHEVIKELRDLAGLGEEEEDNSPIPFKYTPSPGLPKTAMTGEKDTNPFSKPGVQSGQNSNPFNKPGAGSRMEKESVKETDDMEEATDPRDSRPETYRPNNTGYAWDRLSTRSPSDDEDSKATRRGKQMGLKHSIRDALGKHGPKGKLPEDADMDDQGLPHKDEWEYDREGDMAKDQLHSIVRHAEELEHSLGNTENLPEWVQEKMAQIKGMMTGVTDYMMTQHERGEEQRTGEEGIHGDDMEEGNEFSGALAKAKATHQDKFEVDGKEYPVKENNDSLALMKKLAGLK